jgi:predicted aconitase with swiveling domain
MGAFCTLMAKGRRSSKAVSLTSKPVKGQALALNVGQGSAVGSGVSVGSGVLVGVLVAVGGTVVDVAVGTGVWVAVGSDT